MKEALVSAGPKVEIVDSPIPEPNEDQVLIKVVVSGSNPKDWKATGARPYPVNQGDDIAGIVEKVGANVQEFVPGDRVAAFHQMLSPHGSYAEYAIAWEHATFLIPKNTSFEEAATLPLAAMTAAIGLYLRLGLPQPWTPATEKLPLVIYGAASAVGMFAVQLAQRSNIHPLICVAGASVDYVETLIDRSAGDTVIDYREGDAAVEAGLRAASASAAEGGGPLPLLYALDAVSERGTPQLLGRVLAPGARLTAVLPGGDYSGIPEHVKRTITAVSDAHGNHKDFAYIYFRYMSRGLQEGWFRGQRQEIVPGGLAGVQSALERLKARQASGVKYVFRIADTEGVGK